MRYFRVRNLRKYQKYRDRKPKWICVYLDMRADMELDAIKTGTPPPTDTDMWHAVSILMLAASYDDPSKPEGHPPLPMDPVWIKGAAKLGKIPNLDKFVSLGLLQIVTGLGVLGNETCNSEDRTGQDITGQDRTRQDKKASCHAAPSAADRTALVCDLRAKAGDAPAHIVEAYAAACLAACAEYHEQTGGAFTDRRYADMTRRMGKCSFDAQMSAIEVYVDKYAGPRDYRYLCKMAENMNRLSEKELDRDIEKHRNRMGDTGLYSEVCNG